MKIEFFASILGIEASEVPTLYNLENGATDIDDKVAADEIAGHITDKTKSEFSRGKEQGKGWGKKEALKEVESSLKEFGIEASNNVIDSIKELGSKIGSSGTADEKLIKENSLLKQKNEDLNNLIAEETNRKINQEKSEKLESKLTEIIQNEFGTASDRMKKIAIKEFKENYHFEIEGDDIDLFSDKEKTKLLKIDGKHATVKDAALKLFEDLLPKKGKKDLPNQSSGSRSASGDVDKSKGQLLDDLRKAKTIEEKNSIKAQLDKMDEKN